MPAHHWRRRAVPPEPQRPAPMRWVDGAILEVEATRGGEGPRAAPHSQPVQGSSSPHDTSTAGARPGDHRVRSTETGGSWPPSRVAPPKPKASVEGEHLSGPDPGASRTPDPGLLDTAVHTARSAREALSLVQDRPRPRLSWSPSRMPPASSFTEGTAWLPQSISLINPVSACRAEQCHPLGTVEPVRDAHQGRKGIQ